MTPNQTSFILSFTTCGNFAVEANIVDKCASEEEIQEFFATHQLRVSILTGANYIDFDDI